MKNKPVRFGRAIVLSTLFFVTVFSLFGTEHNSNSFRATTHIWAGSLLLIGSTVHLFTNLDWIKAVFSCFGKTKQKRVRQNFCIDLGLLISGTTCALTGAMQLFSKSDLASMEDWIRLHSMSGLFMIVLLGIHLLLHWQWMVSTARQLRETSLVLSGKTPRENSGS